MGYVHTYTTTLREGESLQDINSWLGKFRVGELVRFHAQRTTNDSVRIVLECKDYKRLKILASNPPHQSYLATDKTVPFIDVVFTEPVDYDSLEGNVLFNGVAVDIADMTLEDEDHRLRIDTTNIGPLTAAGQYELIFTDILHQNKIWTLCGERKVIWTTSEHGGSRGGEDIEDYDKRALVMERISIEGQVTEKQILEQFYNTRKIDPLEIIDSIFLAAYPEYERTTLLVIYPKGKIPFVKCVNPEYKSCFFLDNGPTDFNIQVGFTESVDEETLTGQIVFDDSVVDVADWTLSQDNKLLTINVTPGEFKHHYLKIGQIKAFDFTRTWPWFHSFVIHDTPAGAGATSSITDAYATITDGSGTANANGQDTLKIRSPDNLLTVTVTNNDPTHGDNVLLTVNESNFDKYTQSQVDALILAHEIASDPHPVYLTQAEGDALYLADITGESLGDLGDVNVSGASEGKYLKFSGGQWIADTSDGGGASGDYLPRDGSSAMLGNLDMDTSEIVDVEAIKAASGRDLNIAMGDGAGAYKVSFQEEGGPEVAFINSSGNASFKQVSMTGGIPDKNIGLEYAETSVVHTIRASSGLGDSTGGAATGNLGPITGSGADTQLNDNFASIAEEFNFLKGDQENTARVLNKIVKILEAGYFPIDTS